MSKPKPPVPLCCLAAVYRLQDGYFERSGDGHMLPLTERELDGDATWACWLSQEAQGRPSAKRKRRPEGSFVRNDAAMQQAQAYSRFIFPCGVRLVHVNDASDVPSDAYATTCAVAGASAPASSGGQDVHPTTPAGRCSAIAGEPVSVCYTPTESTAHFRLRKPWVPAPTVHSFSLDATGATEGRLTGHVLTRWHPIRDHARVNTLSMQLSVYAMQLSSARAIAGGGAQEGDGGGEGRSLPAISAAAEPFLAPHCDIEACTLSLMARARVAVEPSAVCIITTQPLYDAMRALLASFEEHVDPGLALQARHGRLLLAALNGFVPLHRAPSLSQPTEGSAELSFLGLMSPAGSVLSPLSGSGSGAGSGLGPHSATSPAQRPHGSSAAPSHPSSLDVRALRAGPTPTLLSLPSHWSGRHRPLRATDLSPSALREADAAGLLRPLMGIPPPTPTADSASMPLSGEEVGVASPDGSAALLLPWCDDACMKCGGEQGGIRHACVLYMPSSHPLSWELPRRPWGCTSCGDVQGGVGDSLAAAGVAAEALNGAGLPACARCIETSSCVACTVRDGLRAAGLPALAVWAFETVRDKGEGQGGGGRGGEPSDCECECEESDLGSCSAFLSSPPPCLPLEMCLPGLPLGALPHVDADPRLLLARVSPRNLLSTLTALLAERNLILMTRNTRVLPEVWAAMTALMHPFDMVCPVNPIIPRYYDLYMALDSPCPQVAGAHTVTALRSEQPEAVVLEGSPIPCAEFDTGDAVADGRPEPVTKSLRGRGSNRAPGVTGRRPGPTASGTPSWAKGFLRTEGQEALYSELPGATAARADIGPDGARMRVFVPGPNYWARRFGHLLGNAAQVGLACASASDRGVRLPLQYSSSSSSSSSSRPSHPLLFVDADAGGLPPAFVSAALDRNKRDSQRDKANGDTGRRGVLSLGLGAKGTSSTGMEAGVGAGASEDSNAHGLEEGESEGDADDSDCGVIYDGEEGEGAEVDGEGGSMRRSLTALRASSIGTALNWSIGGRRGGVGGLTAGPSPDMGGTGSPSTPAFSTSVAARYVTQMVRAQRCIEAGAVSVSRTGTGEYPSSLMPAGTYLIHNTWASTVKSAVHLSGTMYEYTIGLGMLLPEDEEYDEEEEGEEGDEDEVDREGPSGPIERGSKTDRDTDSASGTVQEETPSSPARPSKTKSKPTLPQATAGSASSDTHVLLDLDLDALSPNFMPRTHLLPVRFTTRLWAALATHAPLWTWAHAGSVAPPPLPHFPPGSPLVDVHSAHELWNRMHAMARDRGWGDDGPLDGRRAARSVQAHAGTGVGGKAKCRVLQCDSLFQPMPSSRALVPAMPPPLPRASGAPVPAFAERASVPASAQQGAGVLGWLSSTAARASSSPASAPSAERAWARGAPFPGSMSRPPLASQPSLRTLDAIHSDDEEEEEEEGGGPVDDFGRYDCGAAGCAVDPLDSAPVPLYGPWVHWARTAGVDRQRGHDPVLWARAGKAEGEGEGAVFPVALPEPRLHWARLRRSFMSSWASLFKGYALYVSMYPREEYHGAMLAHAIAHANAHANARAGAEAPREKEQGQSLPDAAAQPADRRVGDAARDDPQAGTDGVEGREGAAAALTALAVAPTQSVSYPLSVASSLDVSIESLSLDIERQVPDSGTWLQAGGLPLQEAQPAEAAGGVQAEEPVAMALAMSRAIAAAYSACVPAHAVEGGGGDTSSPPVPVPMDPPAAPVDEAAIPRRRHSSGGSVSPVPDVSPSLTGQGGVEGEAEGAGRGASNNALPPLPLAPVLPPLPPLSFLLDSQDIDPYFDTAAFVAQEIGRRGGGAETGDDRSSLLGGTTWPRAPGVDAGEPLLAHILASQWWGTFMSKRALGRREDLLRGLLGVGGAQDAQSRGADAFDRACFSRLQLRNLRLHALGHQAFTGDLHKAMHGTLCKGWKSRRFELRDRILAYFKNGESIEALESRLSILRTKYAALPPKGAFLDGSDPMQGQGGGGGGAEGALSVVSAGPDVMRIALDAARGALDIEQSKSAEQLSALRMESFRGAFHLIPGRTLVRIPTLSEEGAAGGDGGRTPLPRASSFPSRYVFQLVNPSLTGFDPNAGMGSAGEGIEGQGAATVAAAEVAAAAVALGPSHGLAQGQGPSSPSPVASEGRHGGSLSMNGSDKWERGISFAGPQQRLLTLCAPTAKARREWITRIRAHLRAGLGGAAGHAFADTPLLQERQGEGEGEGGPTRRLELDLTSDDLRLIPSLAGTLGLPLVPLTIRAHAGSDSGSGREAMYSSTSNAVALASYKVASELGAGAASDYAAALEMQRGQVGSGLSPGTGDGAGLGLSAGTVSFVESALLKALYLGVLPELSSEATQAFALGPYLSGLGGGGSGCDQVQTHAPGAVKLGSNPILGSVPMHALSSTGQVCDTSSRVRASSPDGSGVHVFVRVSTASVAHGSPQRMGVGISSSPSALPVPMPPLSPLILAQQPRLNIETVTLTDSADSDSARIDGGVHSLLLSPPPRHISVTPSHAGGSSLPPSSARSRARTGSTAMAGEGTHTLDGAVSVSTGTPMGARALLARSMRMQAEARAELVREQSSLARHLKGTGAGQGKE